MSKRDRLARLERVRRVISPRTFHIFMTVEGGMLERWNEAGEVVETLTLEAFEAFPGEKIRIEPPGEEEEA